MVEKWVCYFHEQEKGMILNTTNGQLISKITGSETTEHWPGHKIILYNDPTISFGGKITGGLRVRQPQFNPQQVQGYAPQQQPGQHYAPPPQQYAPPGQYAPPPQQGYAPPPQAPAPTPQQQAYRPPQAQPPQQYPQPSHMPAPQIDPAYAHPPVPPQGYVGSGPTPQTGPTDQNFDPQVGF